MRKIIISLLVVLSAIAGVQCGSEDVPTTPTYALRDTGPGGGLVFYDKGYYSDGWRYMEAWTADEGSGSTYKWKTTNDSTPGTGTAIGTGYANTYTAMAGTNHPAAEVVRNAAHGGKTDWFLPSKDELKEMCWVLHSMGTDGADNPAYGSNRVGSFASSYYWSSSENISTNAWYQQFINGSQSDASKGMTFRVRAVRAF